MESSTVANSAFQEALQRARQLAAKIAQPEANAGIKRPNDDYFAPDSKKLDQIGSKLAAMKNQVKPQKNQVYFDGVVYNGEKTLDIMIPGNKVGFVIGKGGEMIRNLQDRANVKMVIFQDSSEASDHEKQLRITGPPDKVDYAKQLVDDLLVEKEIESVKLNNAPKMNQPSLNEYGSSRITYYEYPVSPHLIGLVIGKGGETIRKIQADAGCKVQFDTTKTDAQGNKICQFTGSQDSVSKAVELVKEIIDTVTGGQGSVEEIRLVVPTSRTGTVIGRGGETIRALKQQSACNIELDKNFQSDNDEKCFIIRGTADKIGYAQQLVTDKVGGHATVIANTLQSNPLYADSQYGYLTSQIYANQLGQGQSPTATAAAAATTAAQYYWPQTQTAAAVTTADSSKTVQDQYSMWAAYYAQQYYAQSGATPAAAAAASSGANGAAASSAASQPQDDEAVYQQWIEYYKAYGMTKEADAMEQKLKEYQNAKKNNEDGRNKGQQNGNSE